MKLVTLALLMAGAMASGDGLHYNCLQDAEGNCVSDIDDAVGVGGDTPDSSNDGSDGNADGIESGGDEDENAEVGEDATDTTEYNWGSISPKNKRKIRNYLNTVNDLIVTDATTGVTYCPTLSTDALGFGAYRSSDGRIYLPSSKCNLVFSLDMITPYYDQISEVKPYHQKLFKAALGIKVDKPFLRALSKFRVLNEH